VESFKEKRVLNLIFPICERTSVAERKVDELAAEVQKGNQKAPPIIQQTIRSLWCVLGTQRPQFMFLPHYFLSITINLFNLYVLT
jgi:hypothetical protein